MPEDIYAAPSPDLYRIADQRALIRCTQPDQCS